MCGAHPWAAAVKRPQRFIHFHPASTLDRTAHHLTHVGIPFLPISRTVGLLPLL